MDLAGNRSGKVMRMADQIVSGVFLVSLVAAPVIWHWIDRRYPPR